MNQFAPDNDSLKADASSLLRQTNLPRSTSGVNHVGAGSISDEVSISELRVELDTAHEIVLPSQRQHLSPDEASQDVQLRREMIELEKKGITRLKIKKLSSIQIAAVLAAYLVKYQKDSISEFSHMRSRLEEVCQRELIDGESLLKGQYVEDHNDILQVVREGRTKREGENMKSRFESFMKEIHQKRINLSFPSREASEDLETGDDNLVNYAIEDEKANGSSKKASQILHRGILEDFCPWMRSELLLVIPSPSRTRGSTSLNAFCTRLVLNLENIPDSFTSNKFSSHHNTRAFLRGPSPSPRIQFMKSARSASIHARFPSAPPSERTSAIPVSSFFTNSSGLFTNTAPAIHSVSDKRVNLCSISLNSPHSLTSLLTRNPAKSEACSGGEKSATVFSLMGFAFKFSSSFSGFERSSSADYPPSSAEEVIPFLVLSSVFATAPPV